MQSAGRNTGLADSPFSGGFALSASGIGASSLGGASKRKRLRSGLGGRSSRTPNGSGSKSHSASSGFVQGSELSGRRKPIAESPGTKNIWEVGRNHGWLVQRGIP